MIFDTIISHLCEKYENFSGKQAFFF